MQCVLLGLVEKRVEERRGEERRERGEERRRGKGKMYIYRNDRRAKGVYRLV